MRQRTDTSDSGLDSFTEADNLNFLILVDDTSLALSQVVRAKPSL